MSSGMLVLTYFLTLPLLPFVVYFCVKFGTFAYYKGKQLANKKDSNNK